MFADLKVGANVAGAQLLKANSLLGNRGVIPHGEGFILTRDEAAGLGLGTVPGLERHIRNYRNGRDISQASRDVLVIDFLGLDKMEVLERYPAVYQHLLHKVKPARDENNRTSVREKWWLFAEPRKVMRRANAGLSRYIATVQTSKHRFFIFLDSAVLPDDKLIAIASDDSATLGTLSSQVHTTWSLAAGSRLGIGNDPVYNKSACFDAFPFPDLHAADKYGGPIRNIAEHSDAHRKRQQAAHPGLTLTGMYNVLAKLRSGEPLTAKERAIHEQGLVSVLRQFHDELDDAVLRAYGWGDLLPLLRIAHGNDATSTGQTREDARRAFEEAVLERLVALNAERAAEEARGHVRWLRPEFQNPDARAHEQRAIDDLEGKDENDAPCNVAAPPKPLPWPKDTLEQVRAVADALASSHVPLSSDDIAVRFTARGPWKKRLPRILEMLEMLGRAQQENGRYSVI